MSAKFTASWEVTEALNEIDGDLALGLGFTHDGEKWSVVVDEEDLFEFGVALGMLLERGLINAQELDAIFKSRV